MNKELVIKGQKEIDGKEIKIIEGGFGDGQKVMLAKDVAMMHEVELKRINALINNNLDELEFGVDILNLKENEELSDLYRDMGYTQNAVNASKNIYALSERGYIKLYSLMKNKDDKLLNTILKEYFGSNKEIIGFAQNKEIRFRKILKDILKQINLECIFQHKILNYRLDIYIPELNIAIEYDENNHKTYTYEQHEGRQAGIEKKLGCKFIRVADEYSIGEAIGIVLKNMKGMVA